MLRSLAKDAAAHVASWTRLDAIARERLHTQTPFIVGYHRVVERLDVASGFALPAMEITASTFEKHVDWLAQNFEIISLEDFAMSRARRATSKPLAAITFDDGYADVYENAFPVLNRKGIPAAFFVVTDLVDSGLVPVHDRLYAALKSTNVDDAFSMTQQMLRTRRHDDVLEIVEKFGCDKTSDALRPMNWSILAEMRDAGMTIGSHSKTHAFLTNESFDRVTAELRESRSALQQHLGVAADLFAYPGGAFNNSIVGAVRNAGYKLAFTDCHHRDNHNPSFTITRRGLWERSCLDRLGEFSPAIMSCHAAAVFGRSATCEH